MKECSRCNISKDESEFYKSPSCEDGLCPHCKKCHKELSTSSMPDYQERECEGCGSTYQPKASNQKYCGDCPSVAIGRPPTVMNRYDEDGNKECIACEHPKPPEEFYKNRTSPDGLTSKCKACQKAYQRKRYKENKDEILLQQKGYYQENRDERLKYAFNNYERQTGKVKECKFCNDLFLTSYQTRKKQVYCSDKCNYYYGYHISEVTKERRRKYENQRRKEDPAFRLHKNMHAAIYNAIKQHKSGRKWETLVGYTLDELIEHLEKQFENGMNWDNYGEWHIDHIIPKSVFNYSKPKHQDFKRCWALENLQPMWGKENIIKSNNINEPFQPCLQI